MGSESNKSIVISRLEKSAPIPYELLLDAAPSKELVDRYLPLSEIYVALLNSEVIGVYVLYPVNTDVVEIKNISVNEQYQGRGIGTLMLENAEIRARLAGIKKIVIGTGNSSIGQLYLYQKVGFEISEIRKDFFINNYNDVFYENGIQVRHMIMLAKTLQY